MHDQKVHEALSRGGVLRPELQPVRDVLLAHGPKAGLRLLERAGARMVLDALADGTCPLTHEGLDAFLPNRSVAFLRAALVTARVLPERDERFTALERWIISTAEAIPDDGERKLVQRFATWHHLRRVRREAQGRPITSPQTASVRAGIRAAVTLLVWLREHGTELRLCTQGHLDEWIATGTTTRYDARGFIEWCRRNRHIGKGLQIPARAKLSLVQPTDEDDRWALSHRLMHDDAIAIEDRFAGLLVLLYAQPLTVICRLPVTSVVIEGAKISLMLGERPCCCPTPWTRSHGSFSRGVAGTSPSASPRTHPGSSPAPSPEGTSATSTWEPG